MSDDVSPQAISSYLMQLNCIQPACCGDLSPNILSLTICIYFVFLVFIFLCIFFARCSNFPAYLLNKTPNRQRLHKPVPQLTSNFCVQCIFFCFGIFIISSIITIKSVGQEPLPNLITLLKHFQKLHGIYSNVVLIIPWDSSSFKCLPDFLKVLCQTPSPNR